MSDGTSLPAHRGTLILVLGILSIVCCNLVGPVAWVMGNADLKAMREQRMDPAGEGSTNAGRICGIVGTVLLGISLLMMVGWLAFGLFAASAASMQ